MADVTINIPLPVLVANQGFLVEYRIKGTTPWNTHGIETTNTFTVTGLTLGACYEFQITFLQSVSPLVECGPIIKEQCLPEEEPCATIAGEITLQGDVYELTITLTLPSPYNDPCGGWQVVYGPITSPQQPFTTLILATLQGVSPIVVPGATNTAYYLAVYAVGCEGDLILCSETTVEPVSEPCDHATIDNIDIVLLNGAYFLQISVTPSNPPSNIYYISYYQANQVTSGVPDPGGTVIVYPTAPGSPITPETFLVPISPNTSVPNLIISYVGAVVDSCNHSSRFDISYPLG